MHSPGNATRAATSGLRWRSPVLGAATFAAAVSLSGPLWADVTKLQCVEANTKGQDLRREGKLAAARDQLRTCDDPACPAVVRDDCTRRIDEIDKVQPSIVFGVRDGAGNDLIDVRVSVDGQTLVSHLDGTALKVDPGARDFTFEVAGQPPVTRRLLIKEGDLQRREAIVVGSPPAAPAVSVAPPAAGASSSGLGTMKIAGLAAGAAGVVGIGLGTAFGVMASSAWSSAKSACGGDAAHCTNVGAATPFRNMTETDGTVSTVGFIAGGALLAAGAALFLTAPAATHTEAGAPAGLQVVPSVGPREAGLTLRGVFGL